LCETLQFCRKKIWHELLQAIDASESIARANLHEQRICEETEREPKVQMAQDMPTHHNAGYHEKVRRFSLLTGPL